MRGGGIGFALAAGLLLAAWSPSSARADRLVRVRPVLRAADSTATPGRVDPAWRQGLEARARRWRNFPDRFSVRGVDWSRYASRRVGWRPPAAAAAGPHSGLPEGVRPEAIGDPPDTIRVALIRIDFLTDRSGNESTGNGRFDLSGPDTTAIPIDRPPHNRPFYEAHLEALKRYYDAQSYGRTVIEGDVWPRERNGAYSVSDMADFGPWEFSQNIYGAAVHMFRTFLFAADSQSTALGDRIPWDHYDRFLIVHAGGDLQSDVRQDSPKDIPSFTLGVTDSDVVIFPDSTTRPIDRATFVPETVNQDGYYGALNGVIAHECGHLFFGFVDLYDVNSGYPVVGYWSLMDSGNLVGTIVQLSDGSELYAIGLVPPSVDPWQRQWTTDALVPQEVAWGDTMTLRDSERNPDVRYVPLSSDEYLLIENRHQAPADSIQVEQDDSTRVVLGPGAPDRYEYDMLLPGEGALVWHVDQSVIPNEWVFPCDTARANPDCGINTNYFRPGVSVIEADGLHDLGDLTSPYLLGAPFDPFFKSNNATLSDTTAPNLVPHIGTRPHARLNFLDDPGYDMHFAAFHSWALAGWPIAGDFPPGGPMLLAVDADGDRNLEVCWAGGRPDSPDSTALFAVRTDGTGLGGGPLAFAHLDRRPMPVMAAVATGEAFPGSPSVGPSLFAVCTQADGPDTSTAGGRIWLLDHNGVVQPGWPAPLPSIVTTPPVIAGVYPNVEVYVGCADGHVYVLGLDGTVHLVGDVFAGPISGRLAVYQTAPSTGGSVPALVAAGSADGKVAVFTTTGATAGAVLTGWPRTVGGAGFDPDFLWLDFGGASGGQDCYDGALTLVIHHADHMWAYCTSGELLPGWGRALGDTLSAGLGAGDPDGDGFPEVLTQSRDSQVAFWNLSGYPSPGWPRRGTREGFPSHSPALAVDLDADGRSEVVAMNASGIISAMDRDGHTPEGWPLATGLGAEGAPLAVDLDRNGSLEIVAPDTVGVLYAYSVPTSGEQPQVNAWTMLGGDPGRTSALPAARTTTAPAASAGPLVAGSLKAFPNPARRQPVKFAYRLTEPADVEFRIVDASGHQVASFSRRGRQSDNLEEWDPGALPAGLYVARIRFRGAGSERLEMVPLGLIR